MEKPVTQKRLEHLAGILDGMDRHAAMDILSELERDIRFDRGSLRFLTSKLFNPARLFDELQPDELACIVRPLKAECLKTLLSLLGGESERLCRDIAGKRRVEDALGLQRGAASDVLNESILDLLGKGIAEGKIAYNGIALMIDPIPCRPGNETQGTGAGNGRGVFFQTMNPLMTEGTGMTVLICVPSRAGALVRLSLQARGKRFFDGKGWFTPIILDEKGFFYGELFPDTEPGPVMVWLEVPGMGEARRYIFVTGSAAATFSVTLMSMRKSGESTTIDFLLRGGGERKGEKNVRVRLYCSRCGAPVAFGTVRISDSRGTFEFPDPPEGREHEHGYYLHVIDGDHQAGTRIDASAGEVARTPLTESGDRKAGQEIRFPLRAVEHETILYHASSSPDADLALRQLMENGIAVLSGAGSDAPSSGARKPSPLELSLRDDMVLLGERRGFWEMGWVRCDGTGEFGYNPAGDGRMSDLYITLYRIAGGMIEPLQRHVSRLTRIPQVFPFMPQYLEAGEVVDLEIGYYLPREGTLSMINGRKISTPASGSGKWTLPVAPGKRYDLECECPGHETVRAQCDASGLGREFSMVSVRYVRPGTIIDPEIEGCRYEIFGGPGDLYRYFFEQQILSYPWG